MPVASWRAPFQVHGHRRSSHFGRYPLHGQPSLSATLHLRTDSCDGYSPLEHWLLLSLEGNDWKLEPAQRRRLARAAKLGSNRLNLGGNNGLCSLERPSAAVAGPLCWLERRAMTATPLLWPAVHSPCIFPVAGPVGGSGGPIGTPLSFVKARKVPVAPTKTPPAHLPDGRLGCSCTAICAMARLFGGGSVRSPLPSQSFSGQAAAVARLVCTRVAAWS